MPGDVAANSTHVGIVTGERKTVSVTTVEDSPQHGQVVENDWGFRRDQKGVVVFQRYTGPVSLNK